METIEKKKRGRPKGSTKATKNRPAELNNPIEYNRISLKSPQVLIDDHRAKIKDWLNGPQDYSEGLNLLYKDKNKFGVYLKIKSKKSKNHQQKLVHELTAFLYRTEPRAISQEPKTVLSSASNKPEDIASMENLSILEKIQKWLDGPKDYQMGRNLLKIVPDQYLKYLQLHHIETYDSRVRLGFWLKSALNYLKENGE